MNNGKVFRIRLKANHKAFQIQKFETADGQAPGDSINLDEPVAAGVIGYWIDLVGQDCEVLYRRFIHNLPLNLPHSWQHWGKRQRNRANYCIEIPALPDAQYVNLYEQRIPSPQQRKPERQKHWQHKIGVNETPIRKI